MSTPGYWFFVAKNRIIYILNINVIFSILAMPKKKNKDIFMRIECLYGAIPECLKIILRDCGFDNALALELIDENAIKDIESYMQENGKEIIDGLNCCNSDKYKRQNVFGFTPGHKRTIVAISEKARELNEAAVDPLSNRKELKSTIVPKPAIMPEPIDHQLSSPATNPTQIVQIASENLRSSEKNIAISCQIRQGNENHILSVNSNEEQQLKSLLLKKLESVIIPKLSGSETFLMNESHIVGMEIQTKNKKPNGSCKCMCPYCGTTVQSNCKNGNWRISNVVRHLTNHLVLKNNRLMVSTNIPNSEGIIGNDKFSVRSQDKNSQNGCDVNSATDNNENIVTVVGNTKKANKETDVMNQKQFDILKEFDPLSSLL